MMFRVLSLKKRNRVVRFFAVKNFNAKILIEDTGETIELPFCSLPFIPKEESIIEDICQALNHYFKKRKAKAMEIYDSRLFSLRAKSHSLYEEKENPT